MPGWKDKLKGEQLPWLLENDRSQPAIRYFALRDILGKDENDKEVKTARAAVMASGPVPAILAAQHPKGYWGRPGPRFTGTMPAVAFMAVFGADGADPRIRRGCEILLSRYIDTDGSPYNGTYCTAASIGAALIDLGCLSDQRLQTSMEWLARTIAREGKAEGKSGDSASPFACSARNAGLPCAWGAIKAMIAFGKMPLAQRTKNVEQAIKKGLGLSPES